MSKSPGPHVRLDPFKRYASPLDIPVPPDGQCRWCGGPTEPRGKTRHFRWCSKDCLQEAQIRFSTGGWLRERLCRQRQNDHCAECQGPMLKDVSFWECADGQKPRRAKRAVPYCEIDHIVRVVDGGGSCGLDNLRALCRECHAAKTAQDARKAAQSRRAQRAANAPTPLFDKEVA